MVGLFCLPTILSAQFSISGKVIRHNNEPVANIEVNCGTMTAITDSNGNYTFLNVPLNTTCELSASGSYDLFEDITVLDIAFLRHVILQVNTANLYQVEAADMNYTQTLTTLDVVRLTQLALLMDDNVAPDWEFMNANYTVNSSISPNHIDINVTDTITDANLIAIRRGDPAIESDHLPAPTNAPIPTFAISDEIFQAGDNVKFKIKVQDFSNIVGLQQDFKFDTTILAFNSITSPANVNIDLTTSVVNQGILHTISTTPFGTTVADGDVLFEINFTALADAPPVDKPLNFDPTFTPNQVVWIDINDGKLYLSDWNTIFGDIAPTSVNNAPASLELLEIYPNPVNDNLNVNALLQNAEHFEISITNILGQKVYSEKFNQSELSLEIPFTRFPAGTYFLSLMTADGVKTETVFKR